MATAAVNILFPQDAEAEKEAGEYEVDAGYQEPVVFGSDDQWQYQLATGLFDLSRRSPRTLTLFNNEADRNYNGIGIDPDRTCLVIVDMQNYFINPEYCDHPAGLASIPSILRTIERCRREGIQIIWLNWVTNAQELRSAPPAVLRCFNKSLRSSKTHGWGVNIGSALPNGERILFEGTTNAALYDPLLAAVGPDDVFCRKTRMSGMWSPSEDLHQYLTTSGKTTVMFAGINTDLCVLSTLTDTHSWGWDVILLKDCTGTFSPLEAQRMVERNVGECMGFVLDSGALIEAKAEGVRGELARADSGFYSEGDSAIGSEVESGSDSEELVAS